MQTIFLSYARDDDRAPSERQQGWVSFFDKTLGIELRERGLRDFQSWRDVRSLEQIGMLDDKLLAAVTTADLFVAVLSPLYAGQHYCQFELSQFFRARADDGCNAPGDLTVLVLKRPMRDDQFPPELRGMIYLPFFEIDRETNDVKPFFDGFGDAISPRYWELVRKVGSLIEKRLAEIRARESAVSHAEAGVAQPADGPTVYLAEAASDLRVQHWNIRSELVSQGCRVVPDEAWPRDPAGARAHLTAALAEASFSIHLLGAQPGRAPACGLEDLATLQLDLAAERQAGDFRRLIWVAPDLPATAQPALIASLDDGTRLGPEDELVRGGLESFKEVVRDELKRHAAVDTSARRLYLIAAAADEADALALRPALTAAGFEVDLPEFGPDGLVPAAEHQRCLRECDGVLFYWGIENETDTRQRIKEADDAVAALRQTRPFSVRGVYAAPPPSSRKATFASRQIDVIVRDAAGFAPLAEIAARNAGRGR